MRRLRLGLGACAALALLATPSVAAGAGGGGGRFALHRLASFDRPTYLTGPPGAGKLSYVVERAGKVRVLEGSRKRRGTFLDITRRVSCCEVERGMFSIAFPDFDGSPYFYVFYTDRRGDLRIDQFRRRSRFHAKRSSGRHVLRVRHRAAANHNGGQLQFGPDGLLYIATGDGGTGGGPAQRKGRLLGKLLRIRPTPQRHRAYRVPRSNPYVGRTGRNEIYARGLRNPWRFSFDRARIAIGDVGQDRREEVDFDSLRGAKGANYGWNAFEGTLPYAGGSLAHHDKPIHQYSHEGGRCAITGGYVSHDPRLPTLRGRYLFADLCTGEIRSLIPRTRGARDVQHVRAPVRPGLVSFGEDARRRLYVIQQSGGVFRLVRRR